MSSIFNTSSRSVGVRELSVDSVGQDFLGTLGDESVVGNILKGIHGVCEIIYLPL